MGVNARALQAARRRRKRVQAAMMISGVLVAVVVVAAFAFAGGFGPGGAPGAAPVDSTNASVGKPFPAFTLTSATGARITNRSLAGQKSIIWFVDTSTCGTCGPGAAQVGQLDQAWGGNAFQVLLVFVNVTGPQSPLVAWRATYGQPGWLVAADQQDQLAGTVHIPCLDTKFLLDDQGRILNVDSDPVDNSYLSLLRAKTGH